MKSKIDRVEKGVKSLKLTTKTHTESLKDLEERVHILERGRVGSETEKEIGRRVDMFVKKLCGVWAITRGLKTISDFMDKDLRKSIAEQECNDLIKKVDRLPVIESLPDLSSGKQLHIDDVSISKNAVLKILRGNK